MENTGICQEKIPAKAIEDYNGRTLQKNRTDISLQNRSGTYCMQYIRKEKAGYEDVEKCGRQALQGAFGGLKC